MRVNLAFVVAASIFLGPNGTQAQQPPMRLPGTEPWTDRDDPASAMVEGLHRYFDRETAGRVAARAARWLRDPSSVEAYERSVEPNRRRLESRLGAVGTRVSPVEMTLVATTDSPALVGESDGVRIYAVRWGVYPGMEVEGLLLEPPGPRRADIVALPDADLTPESFCGLAEGMQPSERIPLRLARAGCRVLVPLLVDRSDEFSGNLVVRMTNLSHREWIYRMAFETGRHLIGYEVDAVRAAVDWFTRSGTERKSIGVLGYGEGGMIALFASALDPRIDACWVAGYFGPRERLWQEPIERNVWGLLDEFGDAETASLIAGRRPLVIEASRAPDVRGPNPPRNGRNDAASGRIESPTPEQVRSEVARIAPRPKDAPEPLVCEPTEPALRLGAGLNAFAKALKIEPVPEAGSELVKDLRLAFDPRSRQGRQVRQMVSYTQQLLRTSELRRDALWSKVDASSPETWTASSEPFRKRFAEEVIGPLPPASEPLRARTVRLYDEPKWVGYGLELPVWPDVVASGVLLLPKDLQPGERRPVVVCQHGLEGTPDPVVDPRIESVYHSFGARLADLGYIVYAPQNPYIGKDRFRTLQRKAHPLKASLFSVIVRQHERTLEWLAALPNVDPKRIGFYGLSYGGKTAMRVPALLPGYCLSICSADFNEWVVKCTNLERQYGYLYTLEYDMYEFGLAEGFNYAEMAGLIAPRPFMVERGHHDGVAPDEWVAYEYAKVRRRYDLLGIGDRTEIAFFNGGHKIDGPATFAFLAKHLNWPKGAPTGDSGARTTAR